MRTKVFKFTANYFLCSRHSSHSICFSTFDSRLCAESNFCKKILHYRNLALPVIGRGSQRVLLSTTVQSHLPLPNDISKTIILEEFEAEISESPSTVQEGSDEDDAEALLVVYTKFNTRAKVRTPAIPDGEEWQIGYIQAIKHSHVMDRYGNVGVLRLEFPELNSGEREMICDCTGNHVPWYDLSSSVGTVKGPLPRQTVDVFLEDEPQCVIAIQSRDLFTAGQTRFQRVCETLRLYNLPGRASRFLPPKAEESPLTFIARHIEFCTWLVIRCVNTGEYHTLKYIEWEASLFLSYDSTLPEGERYEFLTSDGIQRNPVVFECDHPVIPECVFQPPIANEAFYVAWRPTNPRSSPVLIHPPGGRPDFTL